MNNTTDIFPTNSTSSFFDFQQLNIPYTICEVLVAIMAVIGNAMVIIVFRKERRLRRRTNYYIVSLATADFLVGLLGIPFAILASIGLPRNFYACLFTVSLLVVLCTISIFCLVAVSVDRYWAILHPMGYSRNVRTKTALVIISICWMAGTFVGFLPLLGWNAGEQGQKCLFVKVMHYDYLVFLYFATIITPSLLLAAFYAHIYRVVLKQLRQIVTMNPGGSTGHHTSNGHIRANGGTMLRMLGAAQKREVKATQNLSIIVLFFVICWMPLYTINCVQAFCKTCIISPTLLDFCIILSHLNSAGNPLLYAYHLRDFRAAMKSYILGIFGFGDKNATCMDRNCRPSLASNNCSHRMKYLRNPNLNSNSNKTRFAKSQIDGSKRLPICIPIVQGTTAVVAASAGERTNREMWMIAEVPSTSISENNMERDGAVFPDEASIVRDVTSESSSSGKINSGYVEGPIDDLEIGDDDVFYADASTLSANGYESESSGIIKRYESKNEIVKNKKTWCLSNSSPQLSRSLFVVEAQISNNTQERNKTERRFSTATDRKGGKSVVSLSTSGEFSPSKSLKLSPFKAVGEFLLQHTSNKHSKSANKIEEISYNDLPIDSNKNGTITNQKQLNEMIDS